MNKIFLFLCLLLFILGCTNEIEKAPIVNHNDNTKNTVNEDSSCQDPGREEDIDTSKYGEVKLCCQAPGVKIDEQYTKLCFSEDKSYAISLACTNKEATENCWIYKEQYGTCWISYKETGEIVFDTCN